MDDILNIVGQIGSIGTAVGTILLVFFIWKTLRHLEEASKVSRIQTVFRFRPWVGPVNSIQFISATPNGKHQFSISLKNYGEIPAARVIAKYAMKTEPITKEILKKPELLSDFNLGPLLPGMEKRYWFFIDSNLIENVKKGTGQVFIVLQFTYEYHGGNSEYGSISQYDGATNLFIHKDMWID